MGVSNQSSAISNPLPVSDEYMDAFMNFIEAVSRARKLKKREQVERRLELALRKAFKEQGGQFVRGLSRFRARFTESAQIVSMFGNDAIRLDESTLPTEWMFVWHLVAQKTAGLLGKPIEAAAQASLLQGAGNLIADLGMKISFDLKNPRAIAYLEQYGAKQVANINETTRAYINTIMTQSANEGWSYDKTAEALIDRFQEFAVGKPQAHIDSRAHLIAVTESGNAALEGQMIVAQDLQDAGIMMEKKWSTVGDDRVTEGCKANEDQGFIALNLAFQSGHQRPLRFPGCRCDLLTRMKN